MSVRKRVFVITACIIIAAVVIVVCVELFTGDKTEGFDGSLVRFVTEKEALLWQIKKADPYPRL